jgi:cytochrome d ubiquinol oxidase subunit I
MTKFWPHPFAINFAMGVATGIVMGVRVRHQLGQGTSATSGTCSAGLAAEGTVAFFLESGFWAVLVFGWDKVGKCTHFFATLVVARIPYADEGKVKCGPAYPAA